MIDDLTPYDIRQITVTRKSRPYLFYDTTAGVCSTCLHRVEAKIIFKSDQVFMDKWCPVHGTERVLISDDTEYYRLGREVFVKAPEMPQQFNTQMVYGCPYDCGVCPDHMQHACLSIVEINEHCNLNCPICYAESGTHLTGHRSLEAVCRMLDTVVANEGEADVVQISGGEPTLHPQFFEILDEARKRPIRHLMINTNGIRIAQDTAFVEQLASYGPERLEVYLQFDSLREAALRRLRGADLRRIRETALDRLNRAGISTTLVVTVQRGVNDNELGEIIQYALRQPCVRGVTFQPVQEAGRTDGFDNTGRLTVSEIRRKIIEQSRVFTPEDIVPVPCNPDTLAMGYALKLDDQVIPLTRHVEPKSWVEGTANTIVFEHDPVARERVFELFSTHHSPESRADCLSELMCCLPYVVAPEGLNYRNVFRILIVQFMDASNLDLRSLKKSCVHFATEDGRMIPFEAFNLFYRESQANRLNTLRSQVAASFEGMRTPISTPIPIVRQR